MKETLKEILIENWEIVVIIFPLILFFFLNILFRFFKERMSARKLAIDLSAPFFVIATNFAVNYYFDYIASAYSWLLVILIMMIVAIKSYRRENELSYGATVRMTLRITFVIYFILYFIVNAYGIYTKLM